MMKWLAEHKFFYMLALPATIPNLRFVMCNLHEEGRARM